MKGPVLCMCVGGNTRSSTLARLLRRRGYEALTCGVNNVWSDVTIITLCGLVDTIYVQKDAYQRLEDRKRLWAKPEFLDAIHRADETSKFDFRFDVGLDDWQVMDHPLLVEKFQHLLSVNGFDVMP